MMEDLQTQVVLEGKAEAKTYDKFACFCKDMSEEKTWDIEDAQDAITELTASINELTADRTEQDGVIAEQSEIVETRAKTMKDEAEKRAKSHAVFQAELDDCYLATKEIDFAVAELKAREGAVHGASLISLKGMTKTVRKMALTADAMGLTPKSSKAMTALLQQDPEVPMEDFAFDATEVIKTVKELKPGFEGKAKDLKVAEAKTNGEHMLVMQALTDEKKKAEKLLGDATKIKAEDMEKIAKAQAELTAVSATMTDDQAYLTELTATCNEQSKVWDQRSKMRQDELTALTSALTIVKGKVSDKTSAKTVRLAQQASNVAATADPVEQDSPQEKQPSASLDSDHESDAVFDSTDEKDDDGDDDGDDNEDSDDKSVSFLQLPSPRLQGRELVSAIQVRGKQNLRALANGPDARSRVLNLIRTRSQELQSPVLTALASRLASDPFVKIRKLIQELIERLLQEAADEANHKGFCDKEMGKAKQERDTKAGEVKRLNSEMAAGEAKRDQLTQDIEKLAVEIDELKNVLAKTTKEREDESAENSATVSEAQEGKAAVDEAIDVLSKFYKTAAKAEVGLAQTHTSGHRGVDEDMPDAGFGGAYKGSQGASGGIIGMMEVIQSDFVRTITETEKQERAAQKEFDDFSTATKSSLGTKKVGKEGREEEKAETINELDENKQDLLDEQALLDKSLQELIELQPACVDTGMSYEEKVAKREQEIESLKQALCALDQEGPVKTEPGCELEEE